MEKFGCDFTNTFRVLSLVSKANFFTPQDEDVISKIVASMIPQQGMLRNCKSEFAGQPKLMEIIKTKPEILKLYGIDPD